MGRPSSCKVTDMQFLVSCMNNTENGKVRVGVHLAKSLAHHDQVNTSKVKDETGMASASAVSTELNKIKAENAIANVESTGDDSEKQSSSSTGGKKKGARDGDGKGASAKKRKLAEVEDAEPKAEGVKKEEQVEDDD
ncbi:hypothetical protein KC351_g8619 [Hortaea werneckii]|nr:hypothetical protein KC351_g8619 [Hortaea werneckii]